MIFLKIYFKVFTNVSLCLCKCMLCGVFVHVWARARATMPMETRRRYWIPWSWNYTKLWAASYGCWDPKHFLEEQAAVFTSEPSFWLHVCMYVYKMYMLVQFLVGSSYSKWTFSQTKRQHTIPPHTHPFYLLGARNASLAKTLDLWSHGGIIGRIQPHPERLYFDNMFPLSFDISALFIHSGLGEAVSHNILFSGGACRYKLTKHTVSLAIVISSKWHKQINHSQASQRTTQQNWFSTQQFSFFLLQIPAVMVLGWAPRYIPTLSLLYSEELHPVGLCLGLILTKKSRLQENGTSCGLSISLIVFGGLLR